MRETLAAAALAGALVVTAGTAVPAAAVGEGPSYGGNETVNTSILHTYDQLVAELKSQDAKQERLDLEVIGQSVKGRDLYLAKYISNPRTTRPSST